MKSSRQYLWLFSAVLLGCSASTAPVDDDAGIHSDSDALDASGVDTSGDVGPDTEAPPTEPDWTTEARLPEAGHRTDIYGQGAALNASVGRGLEHTFVWPVTVSGVLLPARWMETLFAAGVTDETTLSLQSLARVQLGFGTLPEMYEWVGLPRLDDSAEALPDVPWPSFLSPGDPLGVGIVESETGPAMSFACATCHTAEFFGKTVVGLTNRRTRANEYFHLAKGFFPLLSAELLQPITEATEAEMAQFLATQQNLAAIENVVPKAQGLDTSLAQVALSLARRTPDEWASFSEVYETTPQENALETFVADSKPAVWWTLKYKTRWLLDGSIVSGNPVLTNFLWNELGRGTDLHDLDRWLDENQAIVKDITALVFATPALRWTDVFPIERIDLDAAKRGETTFQAHCASCHGTYEKGWSQGDGLRPDEQIRTVKVSYHEQTPVLDVGTDPQRAQGMAHFAPRLNELAISKAMGTVVEVQDGYVPPPLEGIFARYPYLHNQSVPSLCALLTPASERPTMFWMGPDADPETDYDFDCVGLPTGDAVPESWKVEARMTMDTTQPGLSNMGHDEWLTDDDGNPVLSDTERRDLIEYLKTL